MNIVGSDGESLKDKWDRDLATYLGIACNKFPNMYFCFHEHINFIMTYRFSAQVHSLWSSSSHCIRQRTDYRQSSERVDFGRPPLSSCCEY